MQREIDVLGEEAYLKKYGFNIDTEEESWDSADITFYIQFAYSFDADDEYEILPDDDYYWDRNVQYEIRVNDGQWYEYTTELPGYTDKEFANYWISEFFEDEGIAYEQGDTVYLRARVLIGDYSYGDYGKIPNEDTYWVSQYSEPIVIPLDGYYRINYVLNGGDFDYNAEILREFTEESTVVVDLTSADYTPTRYGYHFEGWYTTPDFKENSKVTEIKCSQLTGDITLYMKWNSPKYTVTYVLNGGTNATGNPTSFTVDIEDVDDYINIKAPTMKGMIFDGWYYDADLTNALTKTENGYNMHRYGHNITLYAKWIKGRYNITYVQPNVLKSVYNPNPTQYTYGDTVKLQALSTTGYTFGGWYTDAAFTKKESNITATDEGARTYYAKWTENVYNIIYVHDTIAELTPPANKINNSNPATRKFTQKVTLAAPYTGDGVFEFMGWYNNVNFQGEKITEIPANTATHTTLYAKWFKYQWGDINLDGVVTAADARIALRHSVGLEEITGKAYYWANVDQSTEKITASDARLILRMSVGLDNVKTIGLPEIPPALKKNK